MQQSSLNYLWFYIILIVCAILIVVVIDYFLVKNSYKELGKSIDKIFDKVGKIAVIALIISLFKGGDNNDSS